MSLLRHNLCEVTLDPLLVLSFELPQVRSTASSSAIYGDRSSTAWGCTSRHKIYNGRRLDRLGAYFHVRVPV